MRLLPDAVSIPLPDLGPATLVSPEPATPSAFLAEPSGKHRHRLGDVPSASPPSFSIVATYPSPKSSSAAARPLAQGLALHLSHDVEGALAAYERAEAALSKEAKVDLAPLFVLSTLLDFEVTDQKRTELYRNLNKDQQGLALKILNRRGLAYLDDGELETARVAFEAAQTLSRRYAPALYNLACLTAKDDLEQEPYAAVTRDRRALNALSSAIHQDGPFFIKLASADPDLNGLRDHPRYRRIMGLPPPPPGPPRPVGLATHLPAPGSAARAQIDQAFARDLDHDSHQAIELLDQAIPALGAEIAAALPGLDPLAKAVLADGSRIGIYGVLEKRGLGALPPELQDTALMFFNRLALAYQHEGDTFMADSYLKWALVLRPEYPPAAYNQACLASEEAKFLPAEHAAELKGPALAKIDALIAQDTGLFGPLAKQDRDLH